MDYTTKAGRFATPWLEATYPWYGAGEMMCWRRTCRAEKICWVGSSYITYCAFSLDNCFPLPARHCPSHNNSKNTFHQSKKPSLAQLPYAGPANLTLFCLCHLSTIHTTQDTSKPTCSSPTLHPPLSWPPQASTSLPPFIRSLLARLHLPPHFQSSGVTATGDGTSHRMLLERIRMALRNAESSARRSRLRPLYSRLSPIVS